MRRPGFLGDQTYWFDTPKEEVILEESARSRHTSSGSANFSPMSYIARVFQQRKYKFDWKPSQKQITSGLKGRM
jgi:hypothetical protein